MAFLSERHQEDLKKSGLSSLTIARAQLHTGSPEEIKDILGYGTGGQGLVIPYDETYSRVKIDNPGPDGRAYRTRKGGGNRFYVPHTFPPAALLDPAVTLYITEGEKKALKATQEGFNCLALPGVWSWKRRLHGKSLTIPDLDRIEWHDRVVVIVYDSDLSEKPGVAWAEHDLVQELRSRGAKVWVVRLPVGEKGEKYGLDDFLVAFDAERFKALPMLDLAEATNDDRRIFLRMKDLAELYAKQALQVHRRIKLGYPALDEIIRGVAPGEVFTILGRSGVGKTAMALNFIRSMTITTPGQERIPTLKLSLEMQGVEIFERIVSIHSGIEGRDIEGLATREDPMIEDEFLKVIETWDHLVIVDRPCSAERIDQIVGEANEADLWGEGKRLRLLAIDYLGMIIPGKGGRDPYAQVSEIAREVKNIAKRHDLAILLLCQVGRQGESGGIPVTLTGARDSGVVEEAADYILGLWRPELKEDLKPEDRENVRGILRSAALKNRSGPAPRFVDFKWEPSVLRVSGGVAIEKA